MGTCNFTQTAATPDKFLADMTNKVWKMFYITVFLYKIYKTVASLPLFIFTKTFFVNNNNNNNNNATAITALSKQHKKTLTINNKKIH
jgi:hypothetical protein